MAVEKVTLGKAVDSKPTESVLSSKNNTLNTTFLFNTQTNFVPSKFVPQKGLFETTPDLYGNKSGLSSKSGIKTNIFGSGIIQNTDENISTEKLKQPVSDVFAKEDSKTQAPKQNALAAAINNFIIKRLSQKDTTLDKKFISAFPNKEKLQLALETNPRISKILNDVGVYEPKIEMKNLTDIKESHIIATADYVKKLAEKMGCSEDETNDMVMAAMLHDTGKAFIPRDILSKPGKFTPDERAVVNTHAEIGGEVLKSLGYSSNIVDMVKNHHNPYAFDNGSKALRACDMASALREKRYYKEPMSIDKTMEILSDSNVDGDILEAVNLIMEEAQNSAA